MKITIFYEISYNLCTISFTIISKLSYFPNKKIVKKTINFFQCGQKIILWDQIGGHNIRLAN